MDPLSTVSGVISIVTVVGQVIKSIDKLRELCKDLRGLPKDVATLIDQVQVFASDIKTLTKCNTSRCCEDAAIESTLRHCQSASNRMQDLTDELSHTVRAPKSFAKLRIATNRRVIKRAVQKLEQSKADLLSAYFVYDSARNRLSLQKCLAATQAVRQALVEPLTAGTCVIQYTRTIQLSDGRTDIVDSHDSEGYRKGQSDVNVESTKRGAKRVSTIRIRLPLWLCEAAWVMSFQRAAGSWTLHLDMIDAVPRHHRAFGLCRRGNVQGVKTLLDQRVVTLHAQDQDGNSLTRVALAHFQTDLAEFLIDRGGRVEAPSKSDYFDDDGFWNCRPKNIKQPDHHAASKAFAMRLLRHTQFLSETCGLEYSVFEPRSISATDCIATAPSRWGSHNALSKHADICIYMLNAMGSFQSGGVAALENDFFSLRTVYDHSAQRHRTMSFLHILSMAWHMNGLPGWELQIGLAKAILLQGISRGADLSAVNESRRTPFMALLEHAVGLGIAWEWDGTRVFDYLVHAWVSCLSSGNVDLEKYAAAEHQRYREMDRHDEEWWREDGIVGFSSGPNPVDWHVWPRHPGDLYCGMFWDMVENPTRAMPCAYPDFGGPYADLDKWRHDTTSGRFRKSGIKAKTLRWIDALKKSGGSGQTMEARHAMEYTHRIALRNAKAWQAGEIKDDNDEMHQELLDAMANASLDRPDRVGVRTSQWRIDQ